MARKKLYETEEGKQEMQELAEMHNGAVSTAQMEIEADGIHRGDMKKRRVYTHRAKKKEGENGGAE